MARRAATGTRARATSRYRLTSSNSSSRRQNSEQVSGWPRSKPSTRVGAVGSPVPGSVDSHTAASNGTSRRQVGRGFGEDGGGGVGSLDPENELVAAAGGRRVWSQARPPWLPGPAWAATPQTGGLPWPVPAIGDGTQRRAPRRWVAGERHEAKERPIVLRATTTLDDLKDELTGGLVLPGGLDDLFLAIHTIPARAT